MVHLRGSGVRLRSAKESAADQFPVKSDESLGPLNKRSKLSTPFNEWSAGNEVIPIPPSQYNPLDEPSPLGLRLRKSPSLLDLIQMRLSSGTSSSFCSMPSVKQNLIDKKDAKVTSASANTDKRKASNFAASLLRVGNWEHVSRHEGDLVAKFYFAKHKLVWEILDGGLKSKIEIQWSDIIALKAKCPDDGPGTLTVTLARPPLFFKETDPQPRKHTLWQATADFTNGQTSIHRQHFLQCPQGLLNKHYEKLIHFDVRLNLVSQQPETVLDSPYFEELDSISKDQNVSKVQGGDQLETTRITSISSTQDVASPSTEQSCSWNIEEPNCDGITSERLSREAPSPSSDIHLTKLNSTNCDGITSERLSREAPSPSSGMGSHGGDGCKIQPDWEQLRISGLHPSVSMSDLVNHIGHRISARMASINSSSSKEAVEFQVKLDNIAQILLGDMQFTTPSDEKTLMSRVNSLCCLLQDPATAPNVQADGDSLFEGLDDGENIQRDPASDSLHEDMTAGHLGLRGENSMYVSRCKQAPAMSRKDSFGDLLLNLPQIASLPRIASLAKFLFDISEDDENQAS